MRYNSLHRTVLIFRVTALEHARTAGVVHHALAIYSALVRKKPILLESTTSNPFEASMLTRAFFFFFLIFHRNCQDFLVYSCKPIFTCLSNNNNKIILGRCIHIAMLTNTVVLLLRLFFFLLCYTQTSS